MTIEPNVRIGKLTPLTRFVSQSGKVTWECRCGCRRTVTVDESRLTGEHPRQSRSCRSCERNEPEPGDDATEPGSANSGEMGAVSDPSSPHPAPMTEPAANVEPIEADELPDISPLELRGRAGDDKYRVRCKCGVEFAVRKKLLIGSKRIKRCAGCLK